MRFSDKKFFWVGRKVENQVKTFAEDGCTHCFNKYEIPEDFLFLLGFSAVLAGRRDQLYKLWGDSCSYTSQISSVPSESLILTTQVSCSCFTLNSIQNFQNIKHIITAAYESVRTHHSSHLFRRDNLSKSLGKCHRERAEAGFALESAAPTACKQHQEWYGGLPGVDEGALHHWAQTRGDSFVLNLLPFCSEL